MIYTFSCRSMILNRFAKRREKHLERLNRPNEQVLIQNKPLLSHYNGIDKALLNN